MADDWRSWHSTRSPVYHDSILCRTGNNIEEEFLRAGKGGRRRCQECERVSDREGRVEDLPDLTGATFDRALPDGSTVRFLWGVATAGQQVEGRLSHSEWASYCTSAPQQRRVQRIGELGGTQLRLESPNPGLQHWDLAVFAADLDRAAALGLNAYRMSIEWSRVQPDAPDWAQAWINEHKDIETNDMYGQEPDPGAFDSSEFDQAGIARYRRMVEMIVERGMEPIVTLNHMAVPDWVLKAPSKIIYVEVFFQTVNYTTVEDDRFNKTLRGWETRATVAGYLRFVRAIVSALPQVRWWLTFNEPVSTMISSSYLAGVWPPGFMGDGTKAIRVYRRLIEAHVAAFDLIHELRADALVGCSQWIAAARRAPQTIAQKLLVGDNEAAKNQWEYFNSFYFLDAVVHGHDNADVWRKTTPTIRDDWKNRLDFVAIQYYRSVYVFHDIPLSLACPAAGGRFKLDVKRDTSAEGYLKERLSNDLGWTIDPGGLHEVLVTFGERYGLPIVITENGIAEAEDRNRAPFVVAHLQSVLRAIKDGVDVRGYIHWTIADNWEWTFGYQPFARFGLFTVERPESPAAHAATPFRRRATVGALAYESVVRRARSAGTSSGENLFDAIVKRFGTIDPAGRRLVHPTQQVGGFWTGRWAGGGAAFLIHLRLMNEAEWQGLFYDSADGGWSLLQSITWAAEGRAAGRLTFTVEGPALDVTATTRRAPAANEPELVGQATGAADTRAFEARRVLLERVFKRSAGPGGPLLVRLLRLEPDAAWRVAAATRRGAPWEAAGEVEISESDGSVAFTLADGIRFDGSLQDDRLVGDLTGPIPWSGRALPDALPFA